MSFSQFTAAVARIKKLLPLAALAVAGIAVVVVAAIQKSVTTAAVAGGVGLVLALITGWTLSLVAKNQSLQLAAVGVDYLAKVVLLIGSLLLARNVSWLDQRVMGLVLVASILVQGYLQIRIMQGIRGPVVDPKSPVHDVNEETDSQ